MEETIMTVEVIKFDFDMYEAAESRKTLGEAKPAALFYALAALEVGQIIGGLALGLLVAPASLFAARTETEAFVWIVAGFAGLFIAALGVVLIPLALIAAFGSRQSKRYGKICGVIAAVAAILQFPLGTMFGAFLLWKLFKRTSVGEN